MNLPIECIEHSNLIVFRLTGELNSFLLNSLKHELIAKVRESGTYRVLVNMGGIDYITSKDLGVFVQIYRFLDDGRGEAGVEEPAVLGFCNLSRFVADIFDMTRLVTVFRVFDTEERALGELTVSPPQTEEESPPQGKSSRSAHSQERRQQVDHVELVDGSGHLATGMH